jgi:mannose-6-phosphate isomerase-like protein (cupin superfamily)
MQVVQSEIGVQIIKRDDIPGITSVFHQGKQHNIGLLKDWHKHEALKAFVPESARPSFSWTRLKKDEATESHVHPTNSLLILCEGQGEIIGDREDSLEAGDVVLIPAGSVHGFIGRGDNGFWAVSIQFEGAGLFEDVSSPRIFYDHQNYTPDENDTNDLAQLLKEQKYFENIYYNNPLIKLVTSEEVISPVIKERLLEALNFWSDWFQKVIFVRAAFTSMPEFNISAVEHLKDELGHNQFLYELRNHQPIVLWDPILEAISSWFYQKMMTATDAEKTVLMHFVLEGSASIFHTQALKLFPKAHHFEVHSDLDEDHFQLGVDAIKKATKVDISSLRQILRQGWAMLNALCTRIAELALANE